MKPAANDNTLPFLSWLPHDLSIGIAWLGFLMLVRMVML